MSDDRFASSAREYVESLHQNSRTHLLYGKNNVLVQPVWLQGTATFSFHLSNPDQYDQNPRSVLSQQTFSVSLLRFIGGSWFSHLKEEVLGLKQRSQLAFTCFCGAPEAPVALRWTPKPIGRRHSQQFTPTQLVYKHKCVVYLMLHNMHMLQFVPYDLWNESCLSATSSA